MFASSYKTPHISKLWASLIKRPAILDNFNNMTKHFKFSKRLHLATLCCFLFPFFYTGCDTSLSVRLAKEKAEKYKQDSIAAQDSIAQIIALSEISAVQDSIADYGNAQAAVVKDSALIKPVDTIIQNNTLQTDTSYTQTLISQPDSSTFKKETESKSYSETISTKFEFLRPLLIPKEDTYTGLATVIDSIPLIYLISPFICFLFLLISLVVKFIDLNAIKTILLLETFALIFLFIAPGMYSFVITGGTIETFWGLRIWGYWVALTFILALTIYDFYIIRLSFRSTNK